jgi:hypothetical protein
MLHDAPAGDEAQEVVQRQAVGVGALSAPHQHGLRQGRMVNPPSRLEVCPKAGRAEAVRP